MKKVFKRKFRKSVAVFMALTVFCLSLFNDFTVKAANTYNEIEVNSFIEFKGDDSFDTKFVPKVSGRYVIYSEGEYDTAIELYILNGDYLGRPIYEADDDGSDVNFRLDVYLEAGVEYILRTAAFVKDAVYTVHLEMADVEDSVESIRLEIIDPEEPLIIGDVYDNHGCIRYNGFYFMPDTVLSKIKMTVIYVSGKTDAWTYEENDMLLNGMNLRIDYSSQDREPWSPGGDNPVYVTYCGVTEKISMPVRAAVVPEINGFQISANNEGLRTVYSVSDSLMSNASYLFEPKEAGLVYGLKQYVTEEDMVVNSTNYMVYSYSATDQGMLKQPVTDMKYSNSYVMTMKFGTDNPKFFNADTYVRVYVKIDEDTYVYSDIFTYSVYSVADRVYQKQLMSNGTAHDYLYTNILSVVNPDYEKVDYTKTDGVYDVTK